MAGEVKSSGRFKGIEGVLVRASSVVLKCHYQKQLGGILCFQVIIPHLGKSEQEPEAKAMEECFFLACSFYTCMDHLPRGGITTTHNELSLPTLLINPPPPKMASDLTIGQFYEGLFPNESCSCQVEIPLTNTEGQELDDLGSCC